MPSASRARARASARETLGVRLHRLDHLRVDAQDRIERHHRVLEDHRDAVAAQRAHLAFGQLREVLALIQDRAADDAARRIDQADDGEAGDRLAGAGFADQAQHLAAARRENDTSSTAFTTPARVKKCVRRLRTSRVGVGHRLQPRVQHVAQLVADQVDGDDGDQQRDAGIEADPVLARQHVLVAVGDQQAERRLGDRHAEAEEATASPRARWRGRPAWCR